MSNSRVAEPQLAPSCTRASPNSKQASLKRPLRTLAPRLEPCLRPLALRTVSHASRNCHSKGSCHSTYRRCAACFSRNCKLRSHQYHSEALLVRHKGIHVPFQPSASDTFNASYAITIAAAHSVDRLSKSENNAFCQLPLPLDLDAEAAQGLFRDWFFVQATQHFTFSAPEEIASDLLHSPFLAPCFTDSLLCLSIVAAAAATRETNPNTLGSPNFFTLTLIDYAMSGLRTRIDSAPDEVQDNTIAAAVYLWAANLHLPDSYSLPQHAKSVTALIDARQGSGKPSVPSSIAHLVGWVDIVNSLRFHEPCHYRDHRVLVPPRTPLRKYGSFWDYYSDAQSAISDKDVRDACENCCRCIEVMEENIDNMNPASYWYLYQRVPQIYQESSFLRSRHYGAKSVQACVVAALDIVKLLAFNDRGLAGFRRCLMSQVDCLIKAVKRTGGTEFWKDTIDILIWIIITALIAQPAPSDRTWCGRLLKIAISYKFGNRAVRAEDWLNQLRSLLCSFVWSRGNPFDQVEAICSGL